jgi:hypothetical protein
MGGVWRLCAGSGPRQQHGAAHSTLQAARCAPSCYVAAGCLLVVALCLLVNDGRVVGGSVPQQRVKQNIADRCTSSAVRWAADRSRRYIAARPLVAACLTAAEAAVALSSRPSPCPRAGWLHALHGEVCGRRQAPTVAPQQARRARAGAQGRTPPPPAAPRRVSRREGAPRLLVLLAAQARAAVGERDVELRSALHNLLALAGAHVVRDLARKHAGLWAGAGWGGCSGAARSDSVHAARGGQARGLRHRPQPRSNRSG